MPVSVFFSRRELMKSNDISGIKFTGSFACR